MRFLVRELRRFPILMLGVLVEGRLVSSKIRARLSMVCFLATSMSLPSGGECLHLWARWRERLGSAHDGFPADNHRTVALNWWL